MSIELPPLNGFHVFESAARHLSFTRAAEELYVTPAAVSLQIKQLEGLLGFKLFHRLTRQLVLTEEGTRLAEKVRTLLRELSTEINTLQKGDIRGSLTVSVLPSFALKWLVPRLFNFNQDYPEIKIQVLTAEEAVDFRTEKIDMAIRFGRGHYPGLSETFMMRDEIFPVCHPQLLRENKPLNTPADLRHYVLLDDVNRNRLTDQDQDWNKWFAQVGMPEVNSSERTAYNGNHLALEAAITRQGVALARTSTAMNDLAAGRLVRLFDFPIQSEYAYYIVSLPETAEKPKPKIFREWLLEQVGLKNKEGV